MFWASEGSGSRGGGVMQMDKFGRGVTQTVAANLQHTAAIKVFHPSRYNTSITNPCDKTQCTHLCLIIPSGYRCKCPNNIKFQAGSKTSCDAANEEPKPQPLVCKCQNGGFCGETEFWDIGKDAIIGSKAGSKAAVIVPVLLIIVVIICAVALYVYYQRKRGEPKVLGGITNSVSFRQGTNVEFEGPSFVEGGNGVPTKGGEPDMAVAGMTDNRDFSNPMYDMQSSGGEPVLTVPEPSTAVLAPSLVSHQTPPPVKHRELSPVNIDTGKDTQRLVEDDSECSSIGRTLRAPFSEQAAKTIFAAYKREYFYTFLYFKSLRRLLTNSIQCISIILMVQKFKLTMQLNFFNSFKLFKI